ncbi:LacI family DNA-binding transcriptional regulator [Pontibacter sp. SGAir0037]|uniref:LacI family DNA-binding transcriptional regulator n=1 Tax=Pontibacter sp. SGAir0037 TaxID=2571030 RepID=UPI0010CD19B2|nr:LacI family DNA-binding transcriptional regulator [Pontibacter sp. SGAir0037]QCR22401.1 LacI family transcriptional regulator [Pontibacter sp. SGAir0037]
MSKKPQYRLKDIAFELGLSTSTVSRALSDHPHVSEDTKERVKEAVNKAGYQLNAMASSLRKSKSNIIGLIVPRISMYFQSSVITAIQNVLQKRDYNLMIFQSNESPALEKQLVNVLLALRVEGLIVSSTLYTEDFSHFDAFAKANVPLVFYDRVPKGYSAHKIQGEDYQGAYKTTLHLLEKGCRRIAHISGPLSCSLYRERLAGYQDALKKFNVPFDESIVSFQELTYENAYRTCESLFAALPYPDAVFTCNDTTAIAVLDYANTIKLRIPQDFRLAGYSNDPRVQIIRPSITSVEQFPYEMGEQAAALIMDLIHQKIEPGRSFISLTSPVELIVRESTK